MRAQNLQSARQPACEHRRVLGGRSLLFFSRLDFVRLVAFTPKTTILSSVKPNFPTENAQICR